MNPGKVAECSICGVCFDCETEGGIEGTIGILFVGFCVTCLVGVRDLAEQLRLEQGLKGIMVEQVAVQREILATLKSHHEDAKKAWGLP